MRGREESLRGAVSQASFIEEEGRSKYPKSFKSFLHTKPTDFKECCSTLGREAPSKHDFWRPNGLYQHPVTTKKLSIFHWFCSVFDWRGCRERGVQCDGCVRRRVSDLCVFPRRKWVLLVSRPSAGTGRERAGSGQGAGKERAGSTPARAKPSGKRQNQKT